MNKDGNGAVTLLTRTGASLLDVLRWGLVVLALLLLLLSLPVIRTGSLALGITIALIAAAVGGLSWLAMQGAAWCERRLAQPLISDGSDTTKQIHPLPWKR